MPRRNEGDSDDAIQEDNPFGGLGRPADDDFDEPLRRRRDVREDVTMKVRIPAIILIIMSALGIVAALGALVFFVIMLFVDPPQQRADDMIGVAFAFGGSILLLVMKAVAVAGSVQMARMRAYPFAMTAAILQIVPCSPCWILDTPFGLWALIVLMMPDVRAAFYVRRR
jgi:hypothetical protein